MKLCVLVVGLWAIGGLAAAKPLLSDSQKSMTAACIAAEEAPERLLRICAAALEETGGTDAQRLDVQVSLATAYYDLGEALQSEALLKDILSAAPDNTRALNLLGWIAWDADEYAKAAEVFEASLKANPTAQALAGRASSLRRGAGLPQAEFETMMDAAVALSPDYLWAVREKAWGLLAFGDLEWAEATAKQAWAADKGDVHALYLLGYVYNEQGRWKEAYGYLTTASQRENAPTQVFSQRSLASLNLGYLKLALKDAERVVADWPDDSTGYVRKARALDALGRRAEGILTLQTILARGHDDYASYWLAELHYNDGDLAIAAGVLEDNFTHGTADYYDHEFMALLHTELEDYAAAELHIDQALELRPMAEFPHLYRALGLVAAGEYDAADAAVLRAVGFGLPEQSKQWYLRELTARGQFVRAIQMRIAFREE